MKKYIILFFSVAFLSCNDYSPKPSGYPRIERKEAGDVLFENNRFSFLYAADSKLEEVPGDDRKKGELWFNIIYPQYNATVYCTYISITPKLLIKAADDSYRLAFNHAAKADGIAQTAYSNPSHRTFGIVYDIEGSVATPLQFYMTDSVSNFLRGSLYFDREVSRDSVLPVIEYLRDDIIRMIESLEWRGIKNVGK